MVTMMPAIVVAIVRARGAVKRTAPERIWRVVPVVPRPARRAMPTVVPTAIHASPGNHPYPELPSVTGAADEAAERNRERDTENEHSALQHDELLSLLPTKVFWCGNDITTIATFLPPVTILLPIKRSFFCPFGNRGVFTSFSYLGQFRSQPAELFFMLKP